MHSSFIVKPWFSIVRMKVLVALCLLFSLSYAYADNLNGTVSEWVDIECEVKTFLVKQVLKPDKHQVDKWNIAQLPK